MALVDTSIWINLYRKETSQTADTLRLLVINNEAYLCGQIWVEFIGGFKNSEQRAKYVRLFSQYPWLETNKRVYFLAAEIMSKNNTLGHGDAIIAALAILNKQPLFTLDNGFKALRSFGLTLLRA